MTFFHNHIYKNLSPLLMWKGIFYFEDIFFLDKDDLLTLYYSVPEDTVALALKNCPHTNQLLDVLNSEERKHIVFIINSSDGDIIKARKEIEQEFRDGMFLHMQIKCSEKLKKRKLCQLFYLISNISELLDSNNEEKLNVFKNLPFWISAKLMESLPYYQAIKFFHLLESSNTLSESPSTELPPFCETFHESINLPDELLTKITIYKILNRELKIFFNKFLFNSCSGLSLISSQNYREALTFLKKACTLVPEDFFANWSYARALYFCGDTEKAISHYHIAVEQKPLLNQYHLFNAFSLKSGGHMTMAMEEINMLTVLSPDYPYGFKLLGNFHMINGEFSEAIKSLNRSLELLPEDIQTYSALIECYIQQDNMKEAEKLAYKTLEYSDIKKETIYFKLGEIYNKYEDKEKARNFYEKSLKIKEDYYPSITSLGLLELSSGNTEYGHRLLSASLILQPEAVWIRKTLGESYIKTGKLEFALKEFTAILDLYPDEPFARLKVEELNRDLKD
ncbi:MAG: tetratricopeptide repeat protein [Candidatus Eremiobacterota bacterium]